MVNFFVGIFITAGIFAVCLAAAFALNAAIKRFAPRAPEPEREPPAPPEPKPKRRRKARPRSLTISLSGTAFPKGSVVITDGKRKTTEKPAARTAKKTVSSAEKATYRKATSPSRPRPTTVRGGKTTSARR